MQAAPKNPRGHASGTGSGQNPRHTGSGSNAEGRICVGVITGVHGVRGLVKVKSYTETPEDLAAYGPMYDESGEHRFEITLKGIHKGNLLAEIKGVGDRDTAERLRGQYLYCSTENLPETSDPEEFYHRDLIGLRAQTPDNKDYGKIIAVHDFGAGPVIELRDTLGETVFWPFIKSVFLEVNLEEGWVKVSPMEDV